MCFWTACQACFGPVLSEITKLWSPFAGSAYKALQANGEGATSTALFAGIS